MNNEPFGAAIERGVVNEVTPNGYKVASMDRRGILSPALPGINEASYQTGDIVFFFLFRDGSGRILCKA